MRYLPLFELRIRHPFYTDGKCGDFAIEPSTDTEAYLSKRRCSVKPLPDGLRVVTAVTDDGEPLIPLSRGETFSFHLRLTNGDLPLFTDLTDTDRLAVPLYTNVGLGSADSSDLKLGSRQAWLSEKLAVSAPAAQERLVLSGRPLPGLTAADFQVQSPSPIQAIRQYSEGNKLITVDSRGASEGEGFTITYPTGPDKARGVFADADIVVNDSLPHGQLSEIPREFRIAFRAKLARWAYYCVTNLSGTSGSLAIVDAAAGTEPPVLAFGPQNQTDLAAQPDPSDGMARELAGRYPELRRIRFLSDKPVPAQQAARKHLELRVDGERLSASLPNPSFRNYASVHDQDVLFQVVKVLTKTGV